MSMYWLQEIVREMLQFGKVSVDHRDFLFLAPEPTEIYTLSLHDALPICGGKGTIWHDYAAYLQRVATLDFGVSTSNYPRSEEHTSELQSRFDLVCRLLLEKKNHLHNPVAHAITGCYEYFHTPLTNSQ